MHLCIHSLIAFAKSATMYRYVKPIMTESDCLLLENMRHPIMEHFEDRFVENDIGLGLYESQSLPKALIITGS
jgi:DNA mismatch repair ATPase MutS